MKKTILMCNIDTINYYTLVGIVKVQLDLAKQRGETVSRNKTYIVLTRLILHYDIPMYITEIRLTAFFKGHSVCT